jgi:hypothetical protein
MRAGGPRSQESGGKTFGWFRWCLAPSPLLYHCITLVGALGGDTPADAGRGGGMARQSIAAILPNAGRRPALLGKEGERWSARSDGALHLIPCSVTASRSSAHWRDTPRWWGAGWCAEMPIDGCQLHPAQCGPEACTSRKAGGKRLAGSDGALRPARCCITASRSSAHWGATPPLTRDGVVGWHASQ